MVAVSSQGLFNTASATSCLRTRLDSLWKTVFDASKMESILLEHSGVPDVLLRKDNVRLILQYFERTDDDSTCLKCDLRAPPN
jgi:hypothetical protein